MGRPAVRKEVSVRIRFPRDVIAAAKKAAEANRRSQNAEIVFRLSESLGLTSEAKVAP